MSKQVTLEELLLREFDAEDAELEVPAEGEEQDSEDSSQATSR